MRAQAEIELEATRVLGEFMSILQELQAAPLLPSYGCHKPLIQGMAGLSGRAQQLVIDYAEWLAAAKSPEPQCAPATTVRRGPQEGGRL
jgi:hypothetical protein